MGTIPNGLQKHALFQMDGRTWIEPYFPPETEKSRFLEEYKIKKGWMKLIPQDKLQKFVAEVR